MNARCAIKICGIGDPATARACHAAGADMLGVVFHSPSPRHVTPTAARNIVKALPAGFPVIGVFVQQSVAEIITIACIAGLRHVQLHAPRPSADLIQLQAAGLQVMQVLTQGGAELVTAATKLPPGTAILVECGCGPLPGGNGLAWDWGAAAALAALRPITLAGGLTAANVSAAIAAAAPAAVDVSSGVESAPGCKDLRKVADFIAAVRAHLKEQP